MNDAICPQCWKSFRMNRKGRQRIYCSESCKKKAHRLGKNDTTCILCNLRALLQQMMYQIEVIPEEPFWSLINDALSEAYNKLDDAHGYASHDHDRGEVQP